ncbi:hypothetical protein CEXT_49971 [Caerostris extrusa]|uniref:Uncharacterized protein n=1 Tax=Caerostris extrusa TaxID=172846 RepID=A0AAV4V2F9_CAEEX|nr:hypothetical protein CEXT_49971 [Caerostris extrusa]
MTVITHNLQSGNTKSNSSADFKPESGTVAYGMFWWLRNNFQPLIEMVFLRSTFAENPLLHQKLQSQKELGHYFPGPKLDLSSFSLDAILTAIPYLPERQEELKLIFKMDLTYHLANKLQSQKELGHYFPGPKLDLSSFSLDAILTAIPYLPERQEELKLIFKMDLTYHFVERTSIEITFAENPFCSEIAEPERTGPLFPGPKLDLSSFSLDAILTAIPYLPERQEELKLIFKMGLTYHFVERTSIEMSVRLII